MVVFLYKNECVVDTKIFFYDDYSLCLDATPNMSLPANSQAARMPKTSANSCHLGAKGETQSVMFWSKGADTWRTQGLKAFTFPLLLCFGQFPTTKFVQSISTSCIPNYPDKNLPSIFVYNNVSEESTSL